MTPDATARPPCRRCGRRPAARALLATVLCSAAAPANGPPAHTIPPATAAASGPSPSAAVAETVPKPLPPPVRRAADGIAPERLREDATMLCRSNMAGRAAGTKGARRAAAFLAERFRTIGLHHGGSSGGYYQTFKIRAGYLVDSRLTLSRAGADVPLRPKTDFMTVHLPEGVSEATGAVVFAGYGLHVPPVQFDEYAGIDVRGAVVLVFAGEPWSRETAGWLRAAAGTAHDIAWKAREAARRGAVALLVVEDPAGWRSRLGGEEELRLPDRAFPLNSPIPVIQLTRAAAGRVLDIEPELLAERAGTIRRTRSPGSTPAAGAVIACRGTIEGTARIGRNVIGVLPGGDRRLRHQAVVLGAHYDHLGERPEGTLFGANDNAAGVAALLATAEAFRRLPEAPRRTVIFIAFGAEEIGKLGSGHYADRPYLPMERTVTMINFDMIGHNHPNAINAVATRSSSRLHQLHQQANRYVGLELIHPESFRIGRSDHTAFFLSDVPVMYLFGGFHPEYNTPFDTVDRLDLEKVAKVARLAFLTAWMVAEAPTAPAFDVSLPLPAANLPAAKFPAAEPPAPSQPPRKAP